MDNSDESAIVGSKKRKHDVTNVKTENSPHVVSTPINNETESSAESGLPLNWIKCKSKRMNRDYFFNTATGETIWEHPTSYLEKKRKIERSHSRTEGSSSKHVSPLKRDKIRHENRHRSRRKSDEMLPLVVNSFTLKTEAKSFDSDSFRDKQLDSFDDVRVKKESGETAMLSVSMESLSPGDCELVDEEPMDVDVVVVKFRSDLQKPLSDRVSFVEDSSISWDIISVEDNVGIFLIVDTNVFISNLSFVKSLKELNFGSKTIVVVVPYVVLQELDVLKDSDRRSSKERSNKAELVRCTRDAINFIYRELSIKSSYILIQPSTVDAEPFSKFDVKRNDDRVLKCYAQLNKKMKDINLESVVMLCTNDKNLLIKAFASEFIAGTESQLKILLPDIAADPEKYLRASVSSHFNRPEISKKDINGNLPDLTNAKGLLDYSRQVLSTIVEDEFRKVYEDSSDMIFIVKPPWNSLKVVVEVILKHWVAVYRYVWPDDVSNKWLDRFHALYKLLIAKTPSAIDEIEALKLVVKVLEQFAQRITCPNIVGVNRLLGGVRNFITSQENSSLVDEQSSEKIRRKRLPLPVVDPQLNTAIPITPMTTFKRRATVEEICDRVWHYIEESKNSCCQCLLQSLRGDDNQHSKAESNLRLLKTTVNKLIDLMDAVFRLAPDGSENFRSAAQKFCYMLNNFIENASGEKQMFSSQLDVDVFEAFMAIETNRVVFIQAGTHLVSAVNDMTAKLEAFDTAKNIDS